METYTNKSPITLKELGKIWGRDAIFLDEILWENDSTLTLKGTFNGNLCENIKAERWIPYQITFYKILECVSTALNFYIEDDYASSFEKYIDSDRIREFCEILNNSGLANDITHYVFYTYDDVFEIIASRFEIKIN